ncbi:hypothetical protein F4810DRAFT_659187 [Camillea tinctor]|nr:hypothetical protein F4810DRAFT_659187 [Camillea tinctor]
MEANYTKPKIDQTSDETLSDLRELSIQCRALLHQLSANNEPIDTVRVEAREAMASFNIFISAPEISELVQELLVALQFDLEKVSHQIDRAEEDPSTSDSDNSSDRSSSPYRQFEASKVEEPLQSRPTFWTSIWNTTTSLRHLALTVHRAGTRHRQERIQLFKNSNKNKNVYEIFARCARQKVDYMFPNASEVLRGRMAESIATRRMRFLYHEKHQKKTSTLNEPPPVLQPKEIAEEDGSNLLPTIQWGKQHVANLGPSMQPSHVLSSTVATNLDLKLLDPSSNNIERAESVSSIKIPIDAFPSIPKLDPGGISFSCPYCFLICPAQEASGQRQWENHVMHDFEPYFCVFDDCCSPFTCANTYDGWVAHMRDTHTQAEWHCWYCKTVFSGPFSTPIELENHLVENHQEKDIDSIRPTIVKHSVIHGQYALQHCPFCGGFPEEIEKVYLDRDCKQARETLQKHVRDHLIAVALILAPVETRETDDEPDYTHSEPERDSDSEFGLDGVGDRYELECQNQSCDCKESKKSSVFDWPMDPDHDGWEIKDMRAVSNITEIWQHISDKKTIEEGEDPILKSFAENAALKQLTLKLSSLVVEASSFLSNLDNFDIQENPEKLDELISQASSYVNQMWSEQAEQLQVKLKREVIGMEHLDTINGIQDLASTLNHQEEFDKAEETYQQIINSIENLKPVLEKQSKFKEADKISQQILQLQLQVVDRGYPATADITDSVASIIDGQQAEKRRPVGEDIYLMRLRLERFIKLDGSLYVIEE